MDLSNWRVLFDARNAEEPPIAQLEMQTLVLHSS